MQKTAQMKAVLAAAAVALGIAGTAPAVYAAASCGDLDNNGSVAINDVVQHLLGASSLLTPAQLTALCGNSGFAGCGDLNGDGAENISDTQLLLNRASGISNCNEDSCTNRTVMSNGATLPSPITGNVFVPAGISVHVNGITYIEPGSSLTVSQDAKVLGDVTDPPSVIVVKTGARVYTKGVNNHPVIMTSAATPGTRNRQDWGGLVVLGKAPTNQPGATVEGIPPNADTIYGGSDANDFSGCIQYTQIQFSGRELTPDNELNTFTFAGVGRKTVMDHLQAHRGFDDALEWFGGTVNASFTVSSAPGDDGLDTQLGTTGSVQFAVVMQDAAALETPGCNGFEQDDSEFGFNNTPNNYPKYCNVTVLGARYDLATNPGTTNQEGILSRRGNSSQIMNTIIKDFRDSGINLRDPETANHYCGPRTGSKKCVNGPNNGAACTTAGDCGPADSTVVCTDSTLSGANPPVAVVKGVIFNNEGASGTVYGKDDSTCQANTAACRCSSTEFFALCVQSGGCIPSNDPTITAIGGSSFPRTNLVPAAGIVTTAPRDDCSARDSFFVNAPYIGAFQPGQPDWTVGWTSYPVN